MFLSAAGAVAGFVVGFLLARLLRPSEEIPIDGLKQTMRELRDVVGRLEGALGIKPLDPSVYTTGTGFTASAHNLRALEFLAGTLVKRVLNAIDRIRAGSKTKEPDPAVELPKPEYVPRILDVPDSFQANMTRDYRDIVEDSSWLPEYPPPARPAFMDYGITDIDRAVAEPAVDPSHATLIDVYNRAVDDRNRRGEFQERFHPVRIGTVNASDRRRDPSLAAEYKEASDGNFLAIEDNRRMAYLVVPRFDLTVKEANYEAGAIGTVFECRGYEPLLSYSRVMLRRSAVFEKNGQTWVLKTQGLLDLGEGE